MKRLYFWNFIFIHISLVSLNLEERQTCFFKDKTKFDYEKLKGKWYEIVRTNFFYKTNTWKNGVIDLKILNGTIQIMYSGKNSLNTCETVENLKAAFSSIDNRLYFKNQQSGYLKILDIRDDFIIVAFCYSLDLSIDACNLDHLDIFVLSKSKFFHTDDSRINFFHLLEKYCIENIKNLVFSDSDDSCWSNQNEELTADLNLSITNKKQTENVLKQLLFEHKAKNNSKRKIFYSDSIKNSVHKKNNTDILSTTKPYFPIIDLEIKFNFINKTFNERMINRNFSYFNTTIDSDYERYESIEKKIDISKNKSFNNQDHHLIRNFNLTNQTKLDLSNENIMRLKKNQNEQEDQNHGVYFQNKNSSVEFTSTKLHMASKTCPEISCPVTHCSFGRKKNAEGCETCDCLKKTETQCKIPFCHPCFYGSYTDEDGCDSCACKPRPTPKSIYECPKLDCPSCNYGSIKDEYGCESCICIRPNSPESSYKCPPEPECPFGTCEYGSVLNEYGCPTCDCLKSNTLVQIHCSKLRCTENCPYGYYTDKNGCETCVCKPEWMSPCYLSKNKCPIECQFGAYLDRNGCPSCECLPDPNLKTSCTLFKNINPNTDCNEDGNFTPKQCNEKECRCVTQDGLPISEFKANVSDAEQMNCECALALYEASRFKAIGFKVYCTSLGNYEAIQCIGASCACVNEHGDPLGPSVPIYQKHLLRCEGVYQRVYYSKYVTKIFPITLVPPLCVTHRKKALEMENIDKHISVPECDNKGEYLPVQCDRQSKYCWCVNTHNGIEIYGTRMIGEKPSCD